MYEKTLSSNLNWLSEALQTKTDFLPWLRRELGQGHVSTHWGGDAHLTERTKTNMSHPGRRPGTVVGDEQHVLQALWSRKDI